MIQVITIIPWIVVPIILFALLVLATTIVSRIEEAEMKVSARSGVWAGLVLLVIFIISQLRNLREPTFDFTSIPGLEFVPLFVGLIIGFIFLWAVRVLLPTRFVGITTLLLTAASTSALYSFVFVESLRVTVLYIALGVAFGVLFHIVLFPASVKFLWK